MKRKVIILVACLAIVFGWYGKSKYDDSHASEIKYIGMEGFHGDWYDSRTKNSLIVSFGEYDGKDMWSVHLKKGKRYKINYETNISEGEFNFEINNKGTKLITFNGNKNGTETIKANENEELEIIIKGIKAKGNIRIILERQ